LSVSLCSVDTTFDILQTTISTPIVVPVSLPLALIVVAGIYIVALTMMIRVVSQPSLNQVLRLNESPRRR
jgi:hypothetical protein